MPTTFDPSPLPREALDAALRPFGQSTLLPVEAYVDEKVFAWESRHLFERGWVCAGRSASLAEPGAQRAEGVGGTSVLLVRDDAGELRAFANVCSHRGHELLQCGESVVRAVVQCPYHAWTYDLDGSLRIAPRAGDGIDVESRGLVEVPAAEWGGWAFVHLAGDAVPFDEHLGDLAEIAAPWGCDELVVGVGERYEIAANWKLLAENYHECYHCPLIHPELCRVTEAASGRNLREANGAFLGGTMAIRPDAETMSMTGSLVGSVRPGLEAERRRQVVYLQLFPNLMIALHPDYVLTHRLIPVAPTQTVVECEWLFAAEDVSRDGFDARDAVELWDLTNRQDWAAVESVQRGMASPHHRGGVLAHDEDAVYQFVAMVACAHLGRPLGRGVVPADYRR
jgi:Rieske 2Fe-2S family protein